MKTLSLTSKSLRAFTTIELIVVVAVVLVLVGMIVPAMSKSRCGPIRLRCLSNLKQIGIGIRLHYIDSDSYGAFIEANEAWNYFQTVGEDLGSPRILVCPNDSGRSNAAIDFATNSGSFSSSSYRNRALSYFYNPDGSYLDPNGVLSGDRNLSTNSQMISGPLNVRTNTALQWTSDIHKEGGQFVLADGSAHLTTSSQFQEMMKLSSSTNEYRRLMMP